jgi:hypothetical protein
VKNLKTNITEYASNGNKLQTLLEGIEDSLTSLKKNLRSEFDRLLSEEIALSNDLALENDALLAYESATTKSANDESDESKANIDLKLITERDITNKAIIGAIDRQLVGLGRLGGWDYRDHDVFLKIWTQLGIEIQSYDGVLLSETSDDKPESDNNKVITMQVPCATENGQDSKPRSFTVSNRAVLIRKLSKLLPGSNLDEIESHITWSANY